MWLLGIAVVTVLIVLHLTAIPATIWEYDESLFAQGVEQYDPLAHHPPPPGYPLYMAVAKAVAAVAGDPFHALLAVSIAGLILGFGFLVVAVRGVTGDLLTGIVAAFFFYVSPAMLIHGTLPQSDTGALALLGLSMWMCARAVRDDGTYRPNRTNGILLMAVACAATVGWRLQFAIAIVPLFLVSVLLLRGWRARFIAVQTFAIACLLWFVPLVVTTGGPRGFWKWLSGQAAYFAAHDADLSRSGQSMAFITLRFVAHPWGPKWLSFVLLGLAALGAIVAIRRRKLMLLPVAVMTVVYLAFAILMMDPADAVRYALPSLPGIAIAAAIGLTFIRRSLRNLPLEWLPLAAWAAGSYIYSAPVLRQRVDTPSPPVAAIEHLRRTVPKNGVILIDLALRPHAEYLLRGFRTMRIDAGSVRYGLDTKTPLFIFADGEAPGATTFRWESSDAYRKLTRNHFGAASVIAVKPEERFRAALGIYPPERTRDGKSWRWVAERGVLILPDVGATRVRLTFDVPPEYPYPDNRVHIERDGVRVATAKIPGSVEVDAATRLVLVPERSFVPAELPNTLNRDRRRLSVMLTDVEQLKESAVAPMPKAASQQRP
ncbi:MAG TPA: hypothetical protein VF618_20930 [Thermoanaerobaculia bacterium]